MVCRQAVDSRISWGSASFWFLGMQRVAMSRAGTGLHLPAGLFVVALKLPITAPAGYIVRCTVAPTLKQSCSSFKERGEK